MRIFKYELIIGDRVTVPMPQGAKVLTAQSQRGELCLWAEVDPNAPPVDRCFRIVGTGHRFDPDGLRYVATVQSGLLVWHVYEAERSESPVNGASV
jgi:hypothetical protein